MRTEPGDSRALAAFVSALGRELPSLDQRVLDAFASVDRASFVPAGFDPYALSRPVPLAEVDGALVSTISAPDMVALMLQQAELHPGDRVLEVGTASGYSAALMAALGAEVTSIEIIPELVERARANLAAVRSPARAYVGDGTVGRDADAPYNRVMFTCAAARLPDWVWEQTTEQARVVIPLRRGSTYCLALVRDGDTFRCLDAIPCGFVPLIGEAEPPRTDPGADPGAGNGTGAMRAQTPAPWPPRELRRHPSP